MSHKSDQNASTVLSWLKEHQQDLEKDNKIQRVFSKAPWESKVGYCRAIRMGNTIAVTGTVSLDDKGELYGEGDGYLQAKRSLEIIEGAIRPLGADRRNIIRTRIFVTDINRWQEYGKAHGEFFADSPPATSMIEIKSLIDPRMLVEIEADAVLIE
jgi:enamine deaminase RidA (YjgF/YER057c/UK114 family)